MLAAGLLLIAGVARPTVARAAAAAPGGTITVNTTSDAVPAPGECAPTGSQCSLRQAIDAAQAGDTIQLGGTAAKPDTYSVTLGQLTVTKSITIVGQGVGATKIDGSGDGSASGPTRIMKTSQATVTIQSLTFSGGTDENDEAFNGCSPCETLNGNGGGAIFADSTSTLVLTDVVFDGNGGSATPVGGAVASSGSLTMSNVSFKSNSAAFGAGLFVHSGQVDGNGVTFENNGGDYGGGGVFVAGGTVALTNSTFSGNGAANTRGGGLENHAGSVTLAYDSFAGDTRGSIQTDRGYGASTTVGDTIIGSGFSDGIDYGCVSPGEPTDTGPYNVTDYTGTPITHDLGHNIDADGQCGLTDSSDLVGVDPNIAPIADNGGAVQTEALLAGSPAIDAAGPVQIQARLAGSKATSAADSQSCPPTDARGTDRPQGAACDIGAFEAVKGGVAPTATTNPATNIDAADATVNGDINVQGEPGAYFFKYGTSPDQLTSQTPVTATGAAQGTLTEAEDLSGLRPGRTYYAAVVAENATAAVTGNVQSFQTPAEAPSIEYASNDDPTDTSVTISGLIDPGGADTSYVIKYGTDGNLDHQTDPQTIPADADPQDVKQTLTGLAPDTTYTYEIDATNSVGSASSTMPEQAPAQFTTLPQLTGTEGQTVSSQDLFEGYGCPSDATIPIDWGDGTDPTPGQVICATSSDEAYGFTLAGAHTYAQAGHYTITVDWGEGGSQTSYAQIADAPLTATPVNASATAGSAFNGTVATFTDANPLASAGDFTATIDWGDGTAPTSGTVTKAASGGFQVGGTHTYSAAGAKNATVTINDVGGSQAVAHPVIQVASAVADTLSFSPVTTIAATAGSTFSGVVATFTDSNPAAVPSDFTATIDWGDGSPATSGIVGALVGHLRHVAGDPAFQVSGTHTYATSGPRTITVTIHNARGPQGSVQSPVNVATGGGGGGGETTPTNTSPPTISGTTSAGSTLTATPGTWTGSPTTFHYEWLSCHSDGTACTSTGATGSSYRMRPGDVGHTIEVQVTASNFAGSSAPAPSATTAVVLPPGLPLPVAGHSADVGVVSGVVLVKLPGHKRFTPLHAYENVPLGTVIDATHGRVTITVRGPGGKLMSSDFYGGKFIVSQPPGSRYTLLRLTGGNFAACRAPTHAPNAGIATSKRSKPKGHPVRSLWGSGHGTFQTVGKSASASVQGTIWLTADYCNGTLVRVRRGIILVHDFVHHKSVRITAGHSYFS